VTGTLAVALLLAGTRWASYIGMSPLFLTDVLIVAAIADRILSRSLAREVGAQAPAPVRTGYRADLPKLVVVLVAYAVLRMVFSNGEVGTVDWFRDGAPYLYAALALFSAHACARATPRGIERTMTWLWRALVAHLIWVCVITVIGPEHAITSSLPGFGAGLFTPRPDIDSAVLGITGGLFLRRFLLGDRRLLSLVGLLAVFLGATGFTTRAGFIAVALCCVVAFCFAYVAIGRASLKRAGLTLLVPAVLVVAAVLLPSTTVGSRLAATVEPSSATAAASENAVGTTDARKKTWKGVLEWTTADQSRIVFGTGMGTDFLAASGTLKYLEGTDYEGVRSPHDYFIGSFARLGLVGLGLLVSTMLVLLRRLVVFRRRIASEELLVAAALILIAIVSVASFGVVLEAPFGAVPFWWAAGIVLSLATVRGSAEEHEPEHEHDWEQHRY
jgi:hypothetical protein